MTSKTIFPVILKFGAFAQYLILGIVVSTLVWTSFRGLDITDESFYLIGYLNDIEPVFGYTLFHKIYNVFFGFFNFGVVEIRILRIVLSLLSSLLLTHALFQFLHKNNIMEKETWNFHFMFSGIAVASLVGYIWLPQTPSYNTFSCLFLMLIVGFYLYGESSSRKAHRWIFDIAVGFFLAASFYNKFPNLITSLVTLVVFSALTRGHLKKKERSVSIVKNIVAYLIGFIIFSFLLFKGSIIGEIQKYVITIFASGSDSSTDYLEIYKRDFNRLFERIFPYLLVVLVYGFTCYLSLKRTPAKTKFLKIILKVFPFIFVSVFVVLNDSYMGGISRKYLHFDFYLVTLSLVSIPLIIYKKTFNKFREVIIIFLFFLSFLSASLGTNNGLTAQFLVYMPFLIAPMLIIQVILKRTNWLMAIFLLTATASSQIITGMIVDPYRESHGMVAQKYQLTDIEEFKNLLVDSATLDLKNKLEFIREMPPKHLFTYSLQTGISLLANKTPYGFGWYSLHNPSFCVQLIERAKVIEEHDVIFVIPQDHEMHTDVQKALQQKGINFSENFTLAEQIKFEDCQKGNPVRLNVYMHKSYTSAQ